MSLSMRWYDLVAMVVTVSAHSSAEAQALGFANPTFLFVARVVITIGFQRRRTPTYAGGTFGGMHQY